MPSELDRNRRMDKTLFSFNFPSPTTDKVMEEGIGVERNQSRPKEVGEEIGQVVEDEIEVAATSDAIKNSSDEDYQAIGSESSDNNDSNFYENGSEEVHEAEDDFVILNDEVMEKGIVVERNQSHPEEVGAEICQIVQNDIENEVDVAFDAINESDEFSGADNSDDEGLQKRRFVRFNPLIDFKKEIELVSGMIFSSNHIFREAVREFALQGGGDYYYLHNDSSRFSVYCKNRCECPMVRSRKKCSCKIVRCHWKVTGSKIHKDGTFQLKSLVKQHNCTWQEKNSKVTSTWLAEKYLDMYKDDPAWKLSAFIQDVKRKYGVEIKYNHAWKARYRAILKVQGNTSVEYAKIHDYAATIRLYNPGSSTYIKIDNTEPEKPLFQRFYIGLDACIKGFKAGCRPIVGVDGCHLRGAYTGQVLTSIGIDGNNNIFPVAFAVVEAERRDTWHWFLDNLMGDIGEVHPTIMSDRQKGLVEELNDLIPAHKVRICVRHLHNNFKAQWPGNAMKYLLWAAARAYTLKDFKNAMDDIKMIDERAFQYLMSQNPSTWSRHALMTDTKSDMILNNVCESFNKFILPARDKPVISLCEWIRRALMKRFVIKRESMEKHEGTLTPYILKVIEASKRTAIRSCRCIFGGGSTYEVDHYQRTFVVNVEKKTCSCFKWNLTGIPCAHAICCLFKRRANINDYVDPYYTKEMYMKAYGHFINAMPGADAYVKTGKVQPWPPKTVVQPGRPKKHARRKEAGLEPPSQDGRITKRIRIGGNQLRCGQCREIGHNIRRCKISTSVVQPPTSRRPSGRPRKIDTVLFGLGKKKQVTSMTSETSGVNDEMETNIV